MTPSQTERSSLARATGRTAARAELDSCEGKVVAETLARLDTLARSKGYCISGPEGLLVPLEPGQTSGEPFVPDWRLVWRLLSLTRPLGERLPAGFTVLVFGGTATVVPHFLALEDLRVLAVDVTEAESVAGRKAHEALGLPGIKARLARIEKLGLADANFDAVISPSLLAHVDYDEKQRLLPLLARALKPNALLGIGFPYRTDGLLIAGRGLDRSLRNRLSTVDDIARSFLDTNAFEPASEEPFAEAEPDRGELAEPESAELATEGVLILRAAKGANPASQARDSTAHASLAQEELRQPAGTVLSVIVCTYRRPALLRQALQSLVDQELSPEHFEVVVVDNNSKDETQSVVQSFRDVSKNFRYVHEEKQGLSHSRNRGCEEARGDYVVYLDDDAKAHPAYLSTVLDTILTYAPDIMGGPIYPYYTDRRPAWFKDEYEIRRHAKETGWSTKCSISGSSFVIKKDLLKALGGFNPNLGMVGDRVRLGEEKAVLNLYRKRPPSQQKVFYHLDCIVYHHVPRAKMRALYLLKRYFVAGHAKARIERMTREQWGALARSRYVLNCWWGRLASPFLNLKNAKLKRRFTQFWIERGTGFMFELGRFTGCLPFHREEPVEDSE